jgi:hypothetical protein
VQAWGDYSQLKSQQRTLKRGMPRLPPRRISPNVKRNTSTPKLLHKPKPGRSCSRATKSQDSISGKLITVDEQKTERSKSSQTPRQEEGSELTDVLRAQSAKKDAEEDSGTFRNFMTTFGAVPVGGRNFFRLLQNKEAVLLFPGGVREVC